VHVAWRYELQVLIAKAIIFLVHPIFRWYFEGYPIVSWHWQVILNCDLFPWLATFLRILWEVISVPRNERYDGGISFVRFPENSLVLPAAKLPICPWPQLWVICSNSWLILCVTWPPVKSTLECEQDTSTVNKLKLAVLVFHTRLYKFEFLLKIYQNHQFGVFPSSKKGTSLWHLFQPYHNYLKPLKFG